MKYTHEDELMALAFGDLSPAEAQRVEAGLNDASRRELEALRAVKSDMAHLSVPECQLSTERLRDAILNQGLHPQATKAPWWRLSWIPVAAAAAAAICYPMLRTAPVSEPVAQNAPSTQSVAIRQPVTASASDAASVDYDPTELLASGLNDVTREAPQAKLAPSGSNQTTVLTRRPLRRSEPVRTMDSVVANAPIGNAFDATGGRAAPLGEVPSMATADAKSTDPGIVLIGADKDATTGANRAIEVQDSSDVLIGG